LEKGGGEGFMKVISESQIDSQTQNLRYKKLGFGQTGNVREGRV
jgi:hypothetical protein